MHHQRMWLLVLCAMMTGCRAACTGGTPSAYRVLPGRLSNLPIATVENLTSTLISAFPGMNIGCAPKTVVVVRPPIPHEPHLTAETTTVIYPTECKCVPFRQCNENGIIIGGEGLEDIGFSNGPCYRSGYVCCKLGGVKSITPTLPSVPGKHSCGRRNVYGVSSQRIGVAVDNEAKFGEFPWMVAVLTRTRINDTPVNMYVCGGSLIHQQVVLTAAHCLKGKDNLVVAAGEWDTSTHSEPFPNQIKLVSEVVIHEEYGRETVMNDIALLFLEAPVELAPNVATICLPQQGENMDERTCLASGWGKDAYGIEGKYQHILQKVDLPIVPRNTCQAALRTTDLSQHFDLHSSFICAGGNENGDTCQGDGGSPLVCPITGSPGIYVQAGIVSWGVKCETEVPGVYTDVSQFRNWIDSKLSSHNIDMNT